MVRFVPSDQLVLLRLLRPPARLLNRWFLQHVGGAARPVFLDIASTYPTLETLTSAYAQIRAECDQLLGSTVPLSAYHDLDPDQAYISHQADPARRWGVFLLRILGHEPRAGRVACPITCQLLDHIPGLIQAQFSVLEPGTAIPRHHGPYAGYLRYHLGLIVPPASAPTLLIGGQRYTWRAGEAVLFDDSWPHEVDNTSTEVRAVLIVDVLRPLPPLPALVNRAIFRLIAAPTYGRTVARRAARLAPYCA